MATLSIIYDGTLQSNVIQESVKFSKANFILLDILSPTLAENEGLLIGLALLMEIPIVNRTTTKYIPHKITDFEVIAREIGDSKELIAIPQEFSQSEYDLFIGLNASEAITLRAYAISNYNTDIDDVYQINEEILRQLQANATLQQIDIAQDAVISIGLGALATSLVPITAGGSTASLPFFTTGGQPLLP